MDTQSDFSKGALLKFLDFLSARGLAKANTVAGMKSACVQILNDLSSEEEKDIRRVDIKKAMLRFNNKNPSALKPSSLIEYQRRAHRAINEFISYRDDPTGYAGIGGNSPSISKNGGKAATGKKAKRKAPEQRAEQRGPERPTAPPPAGSLTLDYPLRPDFLAQVSVPRDMKLTEAQRLSAFILTLSSEYKPQG